MTDQEQIEELYQKYWQYMIDKDIEGMNEIMSDNYELLPSDVMDLVQSGNVIPVFDKRMLAEYYDVLGRSKFGFDAQNIYDILYDIVSRGMLINDVEQAKVNLIDRDDIPFFEVKECSEELDSYLVTGNIKHFPKSNSTVTPKELVNIMNMFDRFLKTDFDYEKAVQELKSMQEATPKYTSGEDIVDEMFDKKKRVIKKDYFER